MINLFGKKYVRGSDPWMDDAIDQLVATGHFEDDSISIDEIEEKSKKSGLTRLLYKKEIKNEK